MSRHRERIRQVEACARMRIQGAAYPGGGIEAFAGPFGFRIEAGDEMYANHGVNNNLRFTFSPSIRF